jgi:putative transposase
MTMLLGVISHARILPFGDFMPRQPRQFQSGYCYHITTRCNNREFRLTRLECRSVLLYALKTAQDKYRFK